MVSWRFWISLDQDHTDACPARRRASWLCSLHRYELLPRLSMYVSYSYQLNPFIYLVSVHQMQSRLSNSIPTLNSNEKCYRLCDSERVDSIHLDAEPLQLVISWRRTRDVPYAKSLCFISSNFGKLLKKYSYSVSVRSPGRLLVVAFSPVPWTRVRLEGRQICKNTDHPASYRFSLSSQLFG